MITFNGDELNLLGLVESFHSDVVVFVEVAIFKWEDVLTGRVGYLEPFRLLWMDHGILREHNEHKAVQVSELALSASVGIGFVVEGRKEDALAQVGADVLWVTVVASWADVILNILLVHHGAGKAVDELADWALGTVWQGGDTHVRSTDGQEVASFWCTFTLFDDVSSNQCTLRKAYDIDLIGILEFIDGKEGFASLFGLLFEIHGH